jgi:hypothetical protein
MQGPSRLEGLGVWLLPTSPAVLRTAHQVRESELAAEDSFGPRAQTHGEADSCELVPVHWEVASPFVLSVRALPCLQWRILTRHRSCTAAQQTENQQTQTDAVHITLSDTGVPSDGGTRGPQQSREEAEQHARLAAWQLARLGTKDPEAQHIDTSEHDTRM